MKIPNNFLFNYVLTCGQCPHVDKCPSAGIPETYCEWEIDDYIHIMETLTEEYNLNKSSKAIVEILIASFLVAKRGLRDLKFTGLTVDVVGKAGQVFTAENPIKAGLQSEFNRIIRLLKELKITPKEAQPQRKQIEMKKAIFIAKKNLDDVKKDRSRTKLEVSSE